MKPPPLGTDMDVLPSTHIHRFVSTVVPSHTPHQLNHSPYLPCNTRVLANLKSGELSLTHHAFDEIPVSDTFAWNNLVQAHLTHGDFQLVFSTYHQMLLRGVHPDRHTLPRVLAASRLSGHLFLGKQLHGQALKLGFSSDQYVVTALLEIYGRLDTVDTARWLLDKSSPSRNSVSWTLLAKLYIEEDQPGAAIHLFYQMVDLGAEIDSVALATAIGACASLKSLKQGRKVHQVARNCGLEFDVLVSNSLLKMYIDCSSIQDARVIFDSMPSKDIISWTSIIHAYVKKGEFNEGLKLFRQMVKDGLKPDQLSITSILPACARVTANKQGREIHGYLLRNGMELNVTVFNAVIDMYAKSGCINSASKMFRQLRCKDVVSCTIMIMGYSLHGQGDLGVDLFRKMEKDSSILIDQVTYGAVLHACSTARLVEEGKFYFNYIMTPEVTHLALMVALLAHSGLFDEAMAFIKKRKVERNAEVLRALLEGCRIHRKKNLSKWVVEQLCELESLNPENYVMLSNWYAVNAKWGMVNKLCGTIIDLGLKPKKAYSWIELRNKIHVFGTGDVSHPRSKRIYWELQCWMKKIEDEGYRPSEDYSLHDVDEERECIQIGHSEMLALSFGLISTYIGATIRVTKNLRVCRNCHDCAKIISRFVQREIILKDPNRFHHFQDGFCSCGDCW